MTRGDIQSRPSRHPRNEAQQVVGPDVAARVLEPSPPAVDEGPWFADDPVDRGGSQPLPVIAPVPGGPRWDDWLTGHPQQRDWAGRRWLGAYRRLDPPPDGYPDTRLSWHRLAVYVVSPARRRVTGKIALRWTLGGIGTPFFGADRQVRVDGEHLVVQAGDAAQALHISTLNRAAELVLGDRPDLASAADFDVPPPGDPDEPLPIDAAAAAFLSDWYGFAYSVLEELRATTSEASRVQLWPEHFDAAFDGLPGPDRVTFGASPGDAQMPEPYLYVLPHTDPAPGSATLWNASSFRGAILPLSGFLDAPDQRAEALAFLAERRDAVAGTASST
jgi:hypothetical protein